MFSTKSSTLRYQRNRKRKSMSPALALASTPFLGLLTMIVCFRMRRLLLLTLFPKKEDSGLFLSTQIRTHARGAKQTVVTEMQIGVGKNSAVVVAVKNGLVHTIIERRGKDLRKK